jgi:hypothetical protein
MVSYSDDELSTLSEWIIKVFIDAKSHIGSFLDKTQIL